MTVDGTPLRSTTGRRILAAFGAVLLLFGAALVVELVTLRKIGEAESQVARLDHAKHAGHMAAAEVREQYIHQAHTLIEFGKLALERNLHIRLVGLLIARPQDEPYNFYKTPDDVRHVVAHLDQFIEWAHGVGRPDYVKQAQASRDAVLGNASQLTRMPVKDLVPLRVG